MEKGRTVGSYVLFVLREGLFRIKTELIGWRGIVVLVIFGYMFLDTVGAVKEGHELMGQGVGALWLVVLFPARMGKLLYLLPFSRKERIRYLGTYSVSCNVFYVLLFLFMGGVSCLISGYSFHLWTRSFVLCTFPFLLLYSGVVADSMSAAIQRPYSNAGWFWMTSNTWKQNADQASIIRQDYSEKSLGKVTMSAEEKAKAKKQKRFTVAVVLCTVIPAVHGCGNYMYAGLCERWPWLLYTISVLAYVSAAIGLFLYWNRIAEEMNQKGSTGKEESVCNS